MTVQKHFKLQQRKEQTLKVEFEPKKEMVKNKQSWIENWRRPWILQWRESVTGNGKNQRVVWIFWRRLFELRDGESELQIRTKRNEGGGGGGERRRRRRVRCFDQWSTTIGPTSFYSFTHLLGFLWNLCPRSNRGFSGNIGEGPYIWQCVVYMCSGYYDVMLG